MAPPRTASDRQYARRKVVRWVAMGKLVPPTICEECGKEPVRKKRRPIEAHHHKGYDGENAVDVKWLCASCHKLAHPETNVWTPERIAKRTAAYKSRPKVPETAERKQQRREAALKTKPWAADRSNAYSDERRSKLSQQCRETKPWLGRG